MNRHSTAMSMPPPPEFDRHAGSYESDLRKSLPFGDGEYEYFAEYKVRHVACRLEGQNVGRLLDFGCGVGRSLRLFAKYFCDAELWGYDVSTKSLDLARQDTGAMNLTDNIDDLPLGSFDIVFAANVFHHIAPLDRKEILLRCKNLLRAEGRIFLFEHNPLNPLTRFVFDRCPYDKGAKMISKGEALALAGEVGLRVIRSDYTLFFPRHFAFITPAERLLWWLPLGAQYCVEMAI
jgi:SAM-dependent methyltransferase